MKTFLITISFSNPYPKTKEYREEACQFNFAVKKVLKKFRKDFKGVRIKEFSLRCDDLGRKEPYVKKPLAKAMNNVVDLINDFAGKEGLC